MIVVDFKERPHLQEMFTHPWIRQIHLQEEERESHVHETEKDRQKMQGIQYFLEDLGFPKDFIDQTLMKNLFNHVKACRDTLYLKFNLPWAP